MLAPSQPLSFGMQLSSASSHPVLQPHRRAVRARPVQMPPLELDLLLERWRFADEHARCYQAYLRDTPRPNWSDEQLQCLAALHHQEGRALAQVMAHLRRLGLCDVPETFVP